MVNNSDNEYPDFSKVTRDIRSNKNLKKITNLNQDDELSNKSHKKEYTNEEFRSNEPSELTSERIVEKTLIVEKLLEEYNG
ncbi:unnamed protein product [Parnassius apollo]|uniref:(apollo) hypothetical protein n=1 Tax=Parnassius apollo TaxID=110799 RepID=A0A8S3XI91_PARAO|nr:unnamed protein product [Parnassius apollo]